MSREKKVANRGFEVQASTNLTEGVWKGLDVPEKAPFLAADPGWVQVPDPDAAALSNSYYRVRVFSP